MEKPEAVPSETKITSVTEEEKFQELLQSLPKEKNWDGTSLFHYQNFWCPSIALKAVTSFQNQFVAKDTDIILASTPKSGTTWLKALTFLISTRTRCSIKESPLLSRGPHELVPFIEFDLYLKNQAPTIEDLPAPRIFATHVPYDSLPASIRDSGCKIVYVCRNPLDLFISHWHFSNKLKRADVEPLPLEEAFEMFCRGIHSFGPFCDHVLGFWKASLERPDKVLFLKYEDLKEGVVPYTKQLAEFIGFPFSAEEEEQGLVEEISSMCQFDNMKNMEVHKNGKQPSGAPNAAFFRKGAVGDWVNYLKPDTAGRMTKIIEEKLGDSGLCFEKPSSVPVDGPYMNST